MRTPAQLLLVALAIVPVSARAEQAWLYANNPTANQYEPDGRYAHNPAGGKITVSRSGAGAYEARFAGLGAKAGEAGNVQVTAYGPGPEHCNVEGWRNDKGDLSAKVRCWKAAAPADVRFSILITAPTGGDPKFAYAWAGKVDGQGYTADPRYVRNGDGRQVQITRSSAGQYEARFAGLNGSATAGGNVQVTAYGAGSESCKVVGWTPNNADLLVKIACFDSSGRPADSRFSIFVVGP